MKGIIQKDGTILGTNGKTYFTPKHRDSILLAGTSWSRILIVDIIGEEVEFVVSSLGRGYNYRLINVL